MKKLMFAVFAVAMTTLVMELALTRAFDIILAQNISYLVVTSALFGFGLAGIEMTLRPSVPDRTSDLEVWLGRQAGVFGILTALVPFLVNVIPFNYDKIPDAPISQILWFGVTYLCLVIPFFIAGRMLAGVFSALPSRIQKLYFFDLAGAAVGCIIIVPLVPVIGPGGALICCGGVGLAIAALLEPLRQLRVVAGLAAVVLLLLPFARSEGYYDFELKHDKRGLLTALREGKVELTYWDPVARIDVVDMLELDPATGLPVPGSERKHIAYDGGTQSSFFYRFDGDYRRIRDNLHSELVRNFWNAGVLASHWVKRDSGAEVLVIGSAAGQETKAALTFGASHVDAIEMVGAVVDLGLHRLADYSGNVFHHPAVDVRVGEGRSFLRSTDRLYDIIQIFSNHTTSSIASGSGAISTTYLQTSDAYREYFDHLKKDGVLHINHHLYPKMIATAARTWREMGRTDFRKHVIVFKNEGADFLPTTLIKMQPWTPEELRDLQDLFGARYEGKLRLYELVVNPFDPTRSFLSDEFFSGEMSGELLARIPYRALVPTDDRPYFNLARKTSRWLEPDLSVFLDESTAAYLNASLKKGVPLDVAHVAVVGVVSLFLAAAFIGLPLLLAPAGRAPWQGKAASLLYFACLGAGFIIFELVFIQIFMKLIGPPLHTYSTVLFTILMAASLGSAASQQLRRFGEGGWRIPFLGVLVCGALLLIGQQILFGVFLAFPLPARILAAAAMLFPIGFFLGMPFPLGILLLEQRPKGAIAWAWGLNGLFTVIGGLMSVILSVLFGFQVAILVALGIYVLAWFAHSRMRQAEA